MADSGSFYTKSGEELIRYVHFNIYLSATVSHCNLIDLNINYTGVDINLMPICQIWVKLVIIGERIVSIESFIRNPVCNYTQNSNFVGISMHVLQIPAKSGLPVPQRYLLMLFWAV
jgi:hypothetical protein